MLLFGDKDFTTTEEEDLLSEYETAYGGDEDDSDGAQEISFIASETAIKGTT